MDLIQADSSSPDSYHQWETSADSSDVTTPSRRSRLFKTRAETKRPSMDNTNTNTNTNTNANSSASASTKYFLNGCSQLYKPGAVPGQLQRSLSSPQFQVRVYGRGRDNYQLFKNKLLRVVGTEPDCPYALADTKPSTYSYYTLKIYIIRI